jgi:hypothetical protein
MDDHAKDSKKIQPIIYINSLRLSVMELGFVKPTGPGLALPAG